jgi:hypothetical protein
MDEMRKARPQTKPIGSKVNPRAPTHFAPSQPVDYQPRIRKCQPIPTYSPGATVSHRTLGRRRIAPSLTVPGRAQSCSIVLNRA